MADRQNDFDKIKRQASDLLHDLHAHRMAIPAGLIVVLIIGALMVLPKSPAPPPPVQTAPAASSQDEQPKLAQVADLTLIGTRSVSSNVTTFEKENPFAGSAKTSCRVTRAAAPREFECRIGSTVARYACMQSDESGLCAKAPKSAGPSGGGGAPSEGDPGSMPSPGELAPGGPKPKKKAAPTTFYVIDVRFDGKTYKDLEAGDQLPKKGTESVIYAGPNDSKRKATFVVGDGVTVTGATVDPDLGEFELSRNDEVTLTTADGKTQKLRLNRLRKVTR